MQKTIFVTVLALSMCMTASARPEGAINEPTPKDQVIVQPIPIVSPVANKTTTVVDNQTASNVVPGIQITPPAHAAVDPPTKPTSGTTMGSSTPLIPTANTKPSTQAPTTVPTTKQPAPATVPTTKPPVPAPTAAPTTKAPVTTTEHSKIISTMVPPVLARGFDGSSFIGGIVLALGLVAIGFMGLKYYKNQARNYRTL